MSASTASGPNGITAQAARAGIRVNIGATINRNLFAPVGTISSLKTSFNASAIGCSSPIGPTRLGPLRTEPLGPELRPEVEHGAHERHARSNETGPNIDPRPAV